MTQDIELTRKDGKKLAIPYDTWAEEAQVLRDQGLSEDEIDVQMADANEWDDRYIVPERDEAYEQEILQPTLRPQGRPPLPEEEKKEREAVLLEPAIIAAVKRQAHALKITRSAMYRLLILEALDARK